MMSQELPGGVSRSDLKLSDGRTISYYDSSKIERVAQDKRVEKNQPGIG
ncbi:MAG: galactose-1-phosphate uridylyltransferase, partial [Candidatus Nanopelagicaceae bacterium]|nr:galactose-1-phosphate uridylyltransferase [Candidatus Nanopelagicaceae bacterium]